jgi:hypothetical protein
MGLGETNPLQNQPDGVGNVLDGTGNYSRSEILKSNLVFFHPAHCEFSKLVKKLRIFLT